MSDPAQVTFSCSSVESLIPASHEFHRRVSWDVWAAFADVFNDYIVRYGTEGTFARVNGRTVAQIVAEYIPGGLSAIASGEVDGTSYTLYKPAEPGAAADPARLSAPGTTAHTGGPGS